MFAKTIERSSRGGAFTKTPLFFLCFALIACASSLMLSANAYSYVCDDGSSPGVGGCCAVNGEEECPSCTASKGFTVDGDTGDKTCFCSGTAGDEAIIDARCATEEGCDEVLGEPGSHFSMLGCIKCFGAGKVCWPTEVVMDTCANLEKSVNPLNGQIKSDEGKVTCSASSSSSPTSASPSPSSSPTSASASPSATAVGFFLATTMVAMLL